MSSFNLTSAVLRSRSSSLSVLSSSFADWSSSFAVSSSSFALRSSSSLDCASSAAAEPSSASCSRSSMAAASARRRLSISVCRRAGSALRGAGAGTAAEHDPAAIVVRRRGPARDHVERNAEAKLAIHDQDLFLRHGDLFPERPADRGAQERQDLGMPDQTEEAERGVSRLQRDERSDVAPNARDLQLVVDEHAARSEMGGEEGIVFVAGTGLGPPSDGERRRGGKARSR